MPHQTRWNDDGEFVVYILEGEISGDDILDAIDEGVALAQSHPGTKNFCWDGRKINKLVVSPGDVKDIVDRMRQFAAAHPTGRTAVVTSRLTDTAIAELLVIKASTSGRDRERFDTMEEAVAWLTEPTFPNG